MQGELPDPHMNFVSPGYFATLERQMDDSLITWRLVSMLSSAFGFLATLLAAIGL